MLSIFYRPSTPNISRHKLLVLVLLFTLFFSLSVAAHFVRNEYKGHNYELNEYQDGIYYFAMVKNLLHEPISVKDEINEIPELQSVADATLKYFLKNPKQWHLENGLSHSPPYVYRILQPVIVILFSFIGIGSHLGFLLISSSGLGLLGLFLYLLLVNSRVSPKFAIFFSTCFSMAAINLISNPMLTDNLFLGLTASCIYFQKKGFLRSAFLISSKLS